MKATTKKYEVQCQRKFLQDKSHEANGRRLLVVSMPYITVRRMTLPKCLVLFVSNDADHAFSLSLSLSLSLSQATVVRNDRRCPYEWSRMTNHEVKFQ